MIPIETCELVLTNSLRVVSAVDGSEKSMVALHYVLEGLMRVDPNAFVRVLHTYSDTKTYLPHACQREPLRMTCESKLIASVSPKRFELAWVEKTNTAGSHICDAICELGAQYVCLGFYGLKGKKDEAYHDVAGTKLSSNVAEVLNQGNSCSVICIKDESEEILPTHGRKTTFVVSVCLGNASTKAFLDALRLSKGGDEIHVLYIQSFLDSGDDDKSAEIKSKFEGILSSLRSSANAAVSSRCNDREIKIVIEPKQKGETTAEAASRYMDAVEGDFLVVGANASDRVARGKKPVGSVFLQMCLLTSRNFIISKWVDISSKVFEESVRKVPST